MASQFPDENPPSITPPPSPAGPSVGGIVARAKSLLLTPKDEWARIDAEPMTIQGIMTGWAVPLAAIGPVATFIGMQIFGFRVFGIVYRPPIVSSIATAAVTYLASLIGVYAVALVIDNIAPSFGAPKNMVQATKLAVFAFTAAWLAGIVGLIPHLGPLGFVGLYSLYLLWTGLPMLMKPPADKAQTYAFVAIAAGVVAYLVVTLIVGQVAAALTPPVTSVGSMSTN